MPIAFGLGLAVNGMDAPPTLSTTSPASFTCAPWSVGPGNLRATNTFAWDFGDTSTSAVQNPGAHSFPGPGVYTVAVTCTFPGTVGIWLSVLRPSPAQP